MSAYPSTYKDGTEIISSIEFHLAKYFIQNCPLNMPSSEVITKTFSSLMLSPDAMIFLKWPSLHAKAHTVREIEECHSCGVLFCEFHS